MNAESPNPSVVPSWIGDEVPSEEECRAAAEAVLEQGFVATTVYGDAPPVDEYRLSTRPSVVSGES